MTCKIRHGASAGRKRFRDMYLHTGVYFGLRYHLGSPALAISSDTHYLIFACTGNNGGFKGFYV